MQETLLIKNIIEKIRNSYEQQFTGLYKITSHTEAQWYIYFLLGRVTWAQPSKRSLRAWRRHIDIHSPALSKQIGNPVSLYYEYWNYAALSRLVKLKQFPRTQFSKIVEGYVAEVIFDILQAGEWQYDEFGDLRLEMQEKDAGNMPFLMLENLQSWQKAEQSWQQWKQAGLKKVSPGWAPIIKDADALKEQTPLQTFQTLSGFANGENTLRDLAIKVKQPIIPIARSIRPYVSKQLLDFTEISDIVENANHGFSLELLGTHQSSDKPDKAGVDQAPSKATTLETVKKEESVPGAIAQTTDSIDATSAEAESVKAKPVEAEPAEAELAKAEPAEAIEELSISSEKENSTDEEKSDKKSADQEIDAENSFELQASLEQTLEKRKSTDQETRTKLTKVDEPLVRSNENKLLSQEKNTETTMSSSNLSISQKSTQKTAGLKTTIQPAEEGDLNTKSAQINQNRKRQKRNRRSNLPKIVYVDDSPADSRTMAAIIESTGYEYINIPDPLQAIPKLIELRPKLIFLDLVMPIANGYEVCAQIRRVTAFKKTPVIIVTSNDGIADRVRAKIVGASGFMGKPIKEKRVLKVFKKHLSYIAT